MPNILFYMLPEPGHVLPTLRIARSLQAAGHTVSYVSTPSLNTYFRDMGFPTHMLFGNLLSGPPLHDILAAPQGRVVQRQISAFLYSLGSDFAHYVAAKLAKMDIDLLVCDDCILQVCTELPRIVAEISVLSLSVIFPEHKAGAQRSVPALVTCPQEFDIPDLAPSSNLAPTVYVEPSIFHSRPPTAFACDGVPEHKQLVYCSFGTQTLRYGNVSETLERIITAFSDLPHLHLIVSCGDHATVLSTKNSQPNVTVLPAAPQLELLKASALFISHGGLGGLKEAIMCGVPSLVVPQDMDQPSNAQRVEYHGLGVRCSATDCTPAQISTIISDMLHNDALYRRVSAMRAIFWQYELKAPAATFISEYLKNTGVNVYARRTKNPIG